MITSAWRALAAYSVLAIVATWPLTLGLGRDVAWDLGDPLLVIWAIAWDCEQLLGALRGDVGRLATFFDANIFHPAPLTLAYSEHFIAQAVQVLPIYAVTKNPILCYNLLFLATFALSGLGAYLFVRELTGNATAGFVAGVLFAFAPYRIPQSSHLQVLSSQWMPFALYGFRRHFDTGRMRPLAGAALALVAENLSCGYYLLYFSPIAALYVVWEMASRGVIRDVRRWIPIAVAALAVIAVTIPFLLPYAAVREQLELGRARGEVIRYSADVYSYLTAFRDQPLWGATANAFHKAEGDLFPGVVTMILAAVGIVFWKGVDTPKGVPYGGHGNGIAEGVPSDGHGGAPERVPYGDGHADRARQGMPYARVVAPLLAVLAGFHATAAIATLLMRRVVLHVGPFDVQMSDVDQLLIRAAVLFGLLLLVSPAARAHTSTFMRTRGFFVVTLLLAVWLSFGPAPQARGRPVDVFGLYGLLFDYVPGFDGVRVPARFAMIAVLMLAVLGGLGADVISRVRGAVMPLALALCLFLAEGLALPFVVNGATPPEGFNAPEARVRRAARAPEIYHRVAQLPRDAVIAELPLGQPDFDLRAMISSTAHWRPLLNGYSGFFPRHYGQLTVALSDVPRHPDIAGDALRAAGATHVIVHEGAYLGDQGPQTTSALRQSGAVEAFREGGDVLLELRR